MWVRSWCCSEASAAALGLGATPIGNVTFVTAEMCICRIFFGLTLVLRTVVHLFVAVVAAKDLNDILKITNDPFERIVNKGVSLTTGFDLNESIKDQCTIPLAFYIFLGVWLFILTCLFPWRKAHKSRLTLYAMLHMFFMFAVVYMVYIRGISNIAKYISRFQKVVGDEPNPVYEFMAQPELFPVSLVFDVLTFIAACLSSDKSDGVIVSTLPLYRMVSGVSVRVTGQAPPAMPRHDWAGDASKLMSPPAYSPVQTDPVQNSFPSTRIGG